MGKNHHVIRYHYMFWTGTCYLSCIRMYATGIRNHCRYNRTDQCKWSVYIVEPISYFPILGIPGTYLTFLSGNTSNMRVPCSSVAQEAAGVEMGSDKGSVVSTIGIAVSIIVNIVILTIGAIAGNAIIGMMPEGFKQALNFLLPALYGAVFGQFAITRPKLGVVAVVIAFAMNWLMKNGFLSFFPGTPSYVVILVAVFGSIFAGKIIYKKELED